MPLDAATVMNGAGRDPEADCSPDALQRADAAFPTPSSLRPWIGLDRVSAIKRNIMWLLLSQAATWSVSIIVLVIVPNELGDATFGELGFTMVYVGLFGLVATYGTSEYLTKTLARSPADTGHYLFNALVMKLFTSMILAACAIGLGVVLGFTRERLTLILVLCIGMVFAVLNNVLVGGYQALQRMGRPALWNAISLYVGAFVGVTILLTGGSVVCYALAYSLALVIPIIGNALGLRTELRSNGGLDRRVWRLVLTGGFPFFVMSGLLAISGSVDIPMIQVLAGSEAVGWYALAYRWVSMPAFIAVSVATAFFPALSAEGAAASDSFANMANRAIGVVLLVAIPASIGIGLIADDFIGLLYGSEFEQSVPLMRLLALQIPIISLDIVLGTVVVAADRQRQWIIFSAMAAIFNPLTNLIAIPYTMDRFDNGAIGAAFTTVVTEMILMLGALLIRPKGVFDRATRRLVLRIVLAGTTMFPAVLLVGSATLFVQIAVGTTVYVVSSLALKTISIAELRQLRAGVTNSPRSDQVDDVAIGP